MDNCITCEHFAWWDGDYCCTAHMEILQNAPTGEFNSEIQEALKKHGKCLDYEESMDCIRNVYETAYKKFLDKEDGTI